MNPYFILPALSFAFNLGLIPLVLRGNYRSHLHRVFSLFLLSMSLWGLTIYKMRSGATLEEAYLWEQGVFISLAAASLFFFHFTFVFTQGRPRKGVLPVAYLVFLAMIPLTMSGLVVKAMHRQFYGYAPTLGPLFPVFLIYVYLVLVFGFGNMISAYRGTTSHETRNRYGYVIAGVLGSVLGATTDYLPPLGIPMYPLGIVGNIIFSLLTAIAILRHKLLDIRIAIRKGVAYSLLSALLSGVYVGIIFVFNYFSDLGTTASGLVNLSALVLVAMLLQPVLQKVQNTVDRWFYRGRYDHLRALERFGRETKDIIDLDHLSSSLVGLVSLAMQVKVVALLQPSLRGDEFVVTKFRGSPEISGLTIPRRSPLLPWIQRQDKAFSSEELHSCPQWQALPVNEKDVWFHAGGELHVPLKSNKVLTGLLVIGKKESGETYNQEDMAALQTVAYQAATSMENARLYQELKLNLEELRLKEAQLIESAKLASVGTLAAGVAHEVNNPIFAISGRAELLLDQAEKHLKSKRAQEHVQVIYDMAKRISAITQDLLTYSRDSKTMEDVDLNKALDATIKLVDPNLRRAKIEVVRDYDKKLPTVPGMTNKLQQVFMNLILNARDAMASGGTIKLTTSVVDGCVALAFKDTGEGMSPDVVNRLFDPFFTTKEVGKGTGLGLYVSQRIVQQHSGRIQVDTEPGKGSTFTVWLPVSPEDGQAPA